MTTKIGVLGCTGRMGKAIITQILKTENCELAGGTVRPKSPFLGADIGEALDMHTLNMTTTADSEAVVQASDVVIDFTRPQAAEEHLQLSTQHQTPIVVGTTGLGKDQRQKLVNAAAKVPVLFSPNMSIGVTLLTSIVQQLAATLDNNFDIEVVDTHHRDKLDAPSGTAIALGRAAAAGRGVTLEDAACRCRTGRRNPGDIGFSAVRGGNIPGDSKVLFAGDHEVIEISHRALDKGVFASGAVKAALWVCTQKPGLYNMRDVLGQG